MKVLMINSVCGIGSTGRICTDLAEILEEKGHECKIAYGRGIVPEKHKKYAVRIGSDLGVRIHAGLTRIFDNVGFHSKRATKKFIKWIEEYNPDVIHLHNLHGYYIHIGELFAYLKRSKKKVVWSLHDCWSVTGHCSHFDFVGCDRWKTSCYDCPQKKCYPASLLRDGSKSNYKKKKDLFTGLADVTLVTPSEWLAGVIKESYLKEYPIKVIRNGIDLSIFKPTESDFKVRYGIEDKKIVLGVANVWDERKGFQDFIKLSKSLPKEYKTVLVGVNEEQKKELPDTILGISRTHDAKELAQIYTAADVFVNPSVEETMGLTTVEAMACGTPCVVYNRTAVPEVVDSNCGIVVDCHFENIKKSLNEVEKLDVSKVLAKAQEFDKRLQYAVYIREYER